MLFKLAATISFCYVKMKNETLNQMPFGVYDSIIYIYIHIEQTNKNRKENLYTN